MAQVRNRGTNVWQIQIYLGKDGDGKKKCYFETFYGSKSQAKLHASKLELDFKTRIGSSRSTLQSMEDLLNAWLRDKANRIEQSTYEQYHRHATTLKELLGDLQLYTVDSSIISERLKELDIQGLSPRTIKNYYRTLITALNWGARKRHISRDVMLDIKPPKNEHVTRNILKSNELKHFIETAKRYKHYLPLKVLAITGMRTGELMGLKWKNLSNDGRIKIVEAVNAKSRYLKDTKTKNSRREIQLDPETTAELAAYKKTLAQINRANDDDFVFQGDSGSFLPYEALYKTKQEVLKTAGLHHIRLHDLRHGVGSLMLDAGASITSVAEQLGQVPATTAGIYSHSLRKGGTITGLL